MGQEHWPGDWQLLENDSGLIDLSLSQVKRSGSDVYELKFVTKIYANSTTFFVEFLNSEKPDVIQKASAGNVVSSVNSQSIVVVTDVGNSPILSDFRIQPEVVTPNGDGVNDIAKLAFSVFRVDRLATFNIGVFDLLGR